MLRALALAARVMGTTSPNPAVGAVLVRGGIVVGEGATQPPGGAHAEVMALGAAGSLARGATLYVTLEPCSHHGRTPPCASAIVQAGIKDVHVATLDPSPWVNGSGRTTLEAAGIPVVLGERAEEALRINRAFFTWSTTGLPFVTAKYAMSLDGKIATYSGHSRWVSGEHARERVGRLRAQHDAVLVGVETILRDDPLLTARDRDGEPLTSQPLRVVLDSRARTPSGARVVSADRTARALVVCTPDAPEADVARLTSAGAEVAHVPAREGRVDLRAAFALLGSRHVTSVLVEPGGTLLASLLADQAVNELVVFVAAKLVGGVGAPSPLGGTGITTMDEALQLRDVTYEQVGRDLMIVGTLDYRPEQ